MNYKGSSRGLVGIGLFIFVGFSLLILLGVAEDKFAKVAMMAVSTVYMTFLMIIGNKKGWLFYLGVAALIAFAVSFSTSWVLYLFGAIAGMNFGAAWVEHQRVKNRPKAEWLVNGKGYNTASQAKQAALNILPQLDGKKNDSIMIVNGGSAMQVRGSSANGMVAHRSNSHDEVNSWAVLVDNDKSKSEDREIPIAGITGAIPLAFIHEAEAVKTALNDFFARPSESPSRDTWSRQPIAQDLFMPVPW